MYFGISSHRTTELLIVIYSTDLQRPNVYYSAENAALGWEMIFSGVPA
jgi:hypothetical protein